MAKGERKQICVREMEMKKTRGRITVAKGSRESNNKQSGAELRGINPERRHSQGDSRTMRTRGGRERSLEV